MAENEHGRIIASEAKTVLQPAGFRRKGQSRVWIADRGFWLSVVEFQPSSWSKGTYLNVAVHWLWGSLPQTLTFDRSERVGGFVEFQNSAQFVPLVGQMARKVLEIDQIHRSMFPPVQATAAILVNELLLGAYGEWAAFHAGWRPAWLVTLKRQGGCLKALRDMRLRRRSFSWATSMIR